MISHNLYTKYLKICIFHSEYNMNDTDDCHSFKTWAFAVRRD
jgi:hypothetical protein